MMPMPLAGVLRLAPRGDIAKGSVGATARCASLHPAAGLQQAPAETTPCGPDAENVA
jgi:hypothetical protein